LLIPDLLSLLLSQRITIMKLNFERLLFLLFLLFFLSTIEISYAQKSIGIKGGVNLCNRLNILSGLPD